MTQENPQLPWTDGQWDRVQQVVSEEARKARVAASFLPIVGPLPPDTDYVSRGTLDYEPVGVSPQRIVIKDTDTKPLCTLEIQVYLRGPQIADPELTSALQMFRRAANTLARLEDAIIFNGQDSGVPRVGISGVPSIWSISCASDAEEGLCNSMTTAKNAPIPVSGPDGEGLVSAISEAIGKLESQGHLGPFACVLDQAFFNLAQTPHPGSLVLPQDRILPFLGGGPLLRSSTLAPNSGVVVALGGAPVDLVLAKDISVSFLQVTLEPRYVFRVYEKLTLRIKEQTSIVRLTSS
jgi:uncharacterized linocin/CFP29 family protein